MILIVTDENDEDDDEEDNNQKPAEDYRLPLPRDLIITDIPEVLS
jgi:hypothetical protein